MFVLDEFLLLHAEPRTPSVCRISRRYSALHIHNTKEHFFKLVVDKLLMQMVLCTFVSLYLIVLYVSMVWYVIVPSVYTAAAVASYILFIIHIKTLSHMCPSAQQSSYMNMANGISQMTHRKIRSPCNILDCN